MTNTANHITRGKKSMAVKILAGAAIVILAVGIYFAVNYVFQVREYKKRIADISISNVDLMKIPNGSYTGSYDAIMVGAKVQVDISDHAITNITILEHKNERGKKAEVIVNEIKAAQSLKVDTITGATNSSKVLLKSVQNALNSGVK
jgi:uncharacterized protein with FMN-binding domain